MKKVYLDNNATTPIAPEAVIAIENAIQHFGNPSSMHSYGRETAEILEDSYTNISELFGMNKEDIIFTSGASESNNMVLKSLLFENFDYTPHLIVSNIEHPSILNTARFLEKNGIDVTYLPVRNDGLIHLEDIKASIKKETAMISIMTANNEIGTLQPISEIGKFAKENGIFFHTDAVQAAGQIPLDFNSMEIDAASFSAHKMYAAKGIGILYVKGLSKNKRILTPLIHGGHQNGGLRAGTENTLGIVSFGAAAKYMHQNFEEEIKHLKNLRDEFENLVKQNIPDIKIHAENSPRKPNTSNISFKYIEGESILLRLDLEGIHVSTGSACSTGSLDPSHVITAIDKDIESAHGSIRFSFGRTNNMSEIKYTVDKLKTIVENLREISPLRK